MSSLKSSVTVGFACAIGSALLFAVRPIFVKLAYQFGADPTTLMLLRMAMSAPVYALLLVYFLRRRPIATLDCKLIIQIVTAGLMGYYAASFLDLVGLQYVTAQLGRMILYIYPTLVVLINALIVRELPQFRTYIALLVTYFGVALIFGHDFDAFGGEVLKGAFFIVCCALCFAIYLVMSKPIMKKVDSGTFTCIALLAASVGIFVHHAVVSLDVGFLTPVLSKSVEVYWLALLIAVFSTVIPTFLTTAAVVRIGPDRASITAMIGPAFTSIFAVWILNETYTWFHLFGTLFIVFGVALLDRRRTG